MADDIIAPRRDPALSKRIVSGLVLAPVALGLVWAGGYAFAVFVAAFAAAMAWEWVRMSDPEAPSRAFAIATAIAVGGALLSAQGAYGWAALWIAGGAVLAAADRRQRGRFNRALFGQAYVSGAVAALVALRIDAEAGGLIAVLFLLCVVWGADIFAYLAGTFLGGPRLIPSVSPNKTWTGLVAGLIFGTLSGVGVALLFGLDPVRAALIALPTALAAMSGDLVMSLCKRRFGVKDAGALIPGHGGVLDRVDALMMAALFAGAVAVALPGGWPGAGS